MAFRIESPAFHREEMIPKRYTCDGENISPPLQWQNVPEGTKSLALICDDPDAPLTTWTHWVVYHIPPDTCELPESVPHTEVLEKEIYQGKNSWGRIGYGGPCPPGKKPHRYYFRLYALDAEPVLSPGVKKKQLLKAMEGHIVAVAELMGMYARC
ncbi:MAG TPA: YbhB/YbcL family Raf kinase inhibitor-like protein [Thermoplasmatales archaeon]|nr:MAG: YbhB/YbcL family Raf kinase inhibitor-like protein [Thermoplasmata archaeon]HDN50566.1 YbhB/YbcL family Raf kinase inhibitor-like protein [Thermoplasmatales archaeon]